MKIVLLTIQSGKEPWAEEAEGIYLEKLKHFFKFDRHSIKSNTQGRESSEEKRNLESKKILEFLEPSDFLVLLDERGLPFDSEKFAKKWQQIIESGKSRIVLLIGGAFGVNEQIRQRANFTFKLSEFVFNHHLAKVVLMEQLYRAMTIIKGIPYHNK